MLLLKKVFKLRDHSGGQHAEKPFMEHLEDLRDLIVRVVLTLAIATIVCYVFKNTLLDILRRPIEQVWQKSEAAKLPQKISPATWEQAKKSANRTAGLNPEQRKNYYSQFKEKKLEYYAECATYYRAALVIEDKDQRKKFIQELPDIPDDKRDLILTLLEKSPSDAVNARGDVVFMRSLKPTETFMLALKLSVFAGIIISFPLILLYILQFVVPGLKPKERKALYPALLVGFGLFLGGVFFCYFSVLPKALEFFFDYGKDMGVENEWRIGEYISFTTQFTLIFGLAFELPVVVMTLVKIGILNYETMSKTRSYAIISIMVVAAVITPTGDALTLSMLAAPMIILYEICIWLAYFSRKKELLKEEEEREEIRKYHAALAEKGESDESTAHEYEDDYDPDYYIDHHDEEHHDQDSEGNSEIDNDPQMPRIVPVPGRISTDADHEFIEDDYDAEYADDHEGEEIDDGEVEPYDPSEVYTQDDEDNYQAPNSDEEQPEEQLTEDAQMIKDQNEDDLSFEEPEIDFNPGASFEDEHGITDQPSDEKAHDEKSNKKKEDKQDPPKQS